MGDIGLWGRRPFRSRNDRLIIGGLIVGNLLLWGFILSWSGILSLSGIFAPSAAVGQLTGRASVIDGDTIDVVTLPAIAFGYTVSVPRKAIKRTATDREPSVRAVQSPRAH
jgi:hypothetical protein